MTYEWKREGGCGEEHVYPIPGDRHLEDSIDVKDGFLIKVGSFEILRMDRFKVA